MVKTTFDCWFFGFGFIQIQVCGHGYFVDIFQDNVEISELILRDGTRNCNCCHCHLLLSDDMSHDMDTDTV